MASHRPDTPFSNHGYSKEEREFYLAQFKQKRAEKQSLKRGWEKYPEKGRPLQPVPPIYLLKKWVLRQEQFEREKQQLKELKEAEEAQEKETSK